MHYSNLTYVFPRFPSRDRTNYFSRSTLVPEKLKRSNGVLRLGNVGVAAELCLEEPAWPTRQILDKDGVTQWWGQPVGAIFSFLLFIYFDFLLQLHNKLCYFIADVLDCFFKKY